MNAAAPKGTPPRRIDDKKLKKLPCPAEPWRDIEAGVHSIPAIFMIPV
jgi:hypothetical protein